MGKKRGEEDLGPSSGAIELGSMAPSMPESGELSPPPSLLPARTGSLENLHRFYQAKGGNEEVVGAVKSTELPSSPLATTTNVDGDDDYTTPGEPVITGPGPKVDPRHLSTILDPDDIPDDGQVLSPDGKCYMSKPDYINAPDRPLTISERVERINAATQRAVSRSASQAQLGQTAGMTYSPPPPLLHDLRSRLAVEMLNTPREPAGYTHDNFVTVTSHGIKEGKETCWEKIGRVFGCLCCCVGNDEKACC